MLDRFTDRARRVLQLASQEAMRLGHDHVGTEHLLLGLVKEGSGLAAIVMQQLHVDLPSVRQQVEKLTHGPSPSMPGRLRQTDRYMRVLTHAFEEANSLSHNYVGTEHLLLGLLREPEGTATRVLTSLGLELAQVRNSVLNLLGKSPSTKNVLLDEAMAELKTRLADELIDPEKVKAVVEALIHAGWRPGQK